MLRGVHEGASPGKHGQDPLHHALGGRAIGCQLAAVASLWRADADHRLRDRRGFPLAILGYLGELTQAPRIAPAARGPPLLEEGSGPRKGTDLSKPLPLVRVQSAGHATPNLPAGLHHSTGTGGLASGHPALAGRHPEDLTATRNSAGIGPNGLLPAPYRPRAGPGSLADPSNVTVPVAKQR